MSALLEVNGITKRYPGVVANDNVSLTVNAGEVVALLGENGAGKSTLLKAVFGLIKPDSGEIKIGGTPIVFGDTAGVISRGVGMVHQHFQLVPVMTVAENLILGDEPKRGIFINKKAAYDEIIALSKRYGLEVDPDAVIEDLPVGMQQRVEILKALRKDVKLLILDEPTNGLDPEGIQEIRDLLRGLADKGTTVFVSSHLLSELEIISDYIVMLRKGEVVFAGPIQQLFEAQQPFMLVRAENASDLDKVVAIAIADGHKAHIQSGVAHIEGPPDWAGVLNKKAFEAGIVLTQLSPQLPNLEETFFEMTGDKK